MVQESKIKTIDARSKNFKLVGGRHYKFVNSLFTMVHYGLLWFTTQRSAYRRTELVGRESN